MASYRSGLQRYLRNKRDGEIDIKSKTTFNKSSKAYKCMGKELKRQGLAAVDHHPPISDSDLSKVYEYLLKDNLEDPQLLQYKVNILIFIETKIKKGEGMRGFFFKVFW